MILSICRVHINIRVDSGNRVLNTLHDITHDDYAIVCTPVCVCVCEHKEGKNMEARAYIEEITQNADVSDRVTWRASAVARNMRKI